MHTANSFRIPNPKNSARVKALILKGKTNAEIAALLNIELKTVKYHATRLYKANGVRSRIHLILKHFMLEQN